MSHTTLVFSEDLSFPTSTDPHFFSQYLAISFLFSSHRQYALDVSPCCWFGVGLGRSLVVTLG